MFATDFEESKKKIINMKKYDTRLTKYLFSYLHFGTKFNLYRYPMASWFKMLEMCDIFQINELSDSIIRSLKEGLNNNKIDSFFLINHAYGFRLTISYLYDYCIMHLTSKLRSQVNQTCHAQDRGNQNACCAHGRIDFGTNSKEKILVNIPNPKFNKKFRIEHDGWDTLHEYYTDDEDSDYDVFEQQHKYIQVECCASFTAKGEPVPKYCDKDLCCRDRSVAARRRWRCRGRFWRPIRRWFPWR